MTFRKMLAIMIAAIALVGARSASVALAQTCGISTVGQKWTHCEYRDEADQPPTWRSGLCQNGDDLVISQWMTPACYNERGLLFATVMSPQSSSGDYDLAWLETPKKLRFRRVLPMYVDVRIRNINVYSSSSEIEGYDEATGQPYVVLPVQITPVSYRRATIVEDQEIQVLWQPYVLPPSPPCTGNNCGGTKG